MPRNISATINVGKSLAARAVHVVVQPPPRTVYESRQVLRVLKDFGDVIMFRGLRYASVDAVPNAILAVYQTPEAASKLLAASPLSFDAEPARPQSFITSSASFGIPYIFEDTSKIHVSDSEDKPEQSASLSELPVSNDSVPREFHLRVDKSFADHQSYLARQEYYWGFVPKSKTFAYDQLRKAVPIEGLASISTDQVQLHNRLVTKNFAEITQRKTLRELWEDGRQAPQTHTDAIIIEHAGSRNL